MQERVVHFVNPWSSYYVLPQRSPQACDGLNWLVVGQEMSAYQVLFSL